MSAWDEFAKGVLRFRKTGLYRYIEWSNNTLLGPLARPITKLLDKAFGKSIDRLTKR